MRWRGASGGVAPGPIPRLTQIGRFGTRWNQRADLKSEAYEERQTARSFVHVFLQQTRKEWRPKPGVDWSASICLDAGGIADLNRRIQVAHPVWISSRTPVSTA